MRSETAEAVTRSQRPLGGYRLPPFQMRSSTDGTRSVAGRVSAQPSSEGVNASSEEGLRNPPFFWQFVKSGLDTPSCLEMVELLEAPAFSTRSPPSMAAFPAAFFIACGRPNPDRCPLPIPPVLLLLTGDHLEEVGGVTTRGMGPLEWVGTPGVFFWHSAETKHPAASARYRKTACVQTPSREG